MSRERRLVALLPEEQTMIARLRYLRSIACGVTAGLARFADTFWTARRGALAAMSLHAELSRLSDAELARRGLARDDVNRLVFDELIGKVAPAATAPQPQGSGAHPAISDARGETSRSPNRPHI
jgi:hypothetical protein